MRKLIKLILILEIISMIVFAKSHSVFCEKLIKLDTIFKEMGIFSEYLSDFFVIKDIKRKGEERTFRTILAKNIKYEQVRIEYISNIIPEEADKLIKERFMVLEGLYMTLPSPYPGMVSSEVIGYHPDLKPEIDEMVICNKKEKVYFLYSTERFTYGVKSKEQIKYKGANFFIYVENRKILIQLELFVPIEIYEKTNISEVLKRLKYLE